jgi:hypothetical protein
MKVNNLEKSVFAITIAQLYDVTLDGAPALYEVTLDGEHFDYAESYEAAENMAVFASLL